MALVYMATNTVNGKRYIGYTSRSLQYRISRHLRVASGKSPNMKFARAIKKYGKDSFKWEIIEDNLTEDSALQLEIDLIAKLKPEYNIAPGGRGTRPKFQPIICLSDNKLYPSVREAAQSYELCTSRITQLCQTGRKTKTGLKFSFAGRVGRRASPRKKVVCLDDGKVYDSALAASIYYTIHPSTIADACRGYYASAHGKHFSYCDGILSENECKCLLEASLQKTAKIAENRKLAAIKSNGRPVICLNDGKRFETARAAELEYKLCQSSVSNLCQTGGKTKNGLRFMYADQKEPIKQLPPGFHNRKQIINLDDNVLYESMVAAGKALNRSDCAVRIAVKHGSMCAGKRLAYAA